MAHFLTRLLGAGAVLAALGAGPAMAQDDFGLWDTDDDGVLSEEEFDEGWGETGAFGDFDVNGDGVLTEDEYEESLSGYSGEDDDDLGEPEDGELEDDDEFGDDENFGEW